MCSIAHELRPVDVRTASYRAARQGGWAWGFAAIPVALLIFPLFAVFEAVGAAVQSGAWPAEVIDARRWLNLLRNSGVVCGVALGVALGLGAPLALLLARCRLPGRSVYLAFIAYAACLPSYVFSIFALAAIPGVHLSQSALLCGVLYGVLYLPLATLLIAAAMRLLDSDLEDAARVDGTSWEIARQVVFPQMWPAVVCVATVLSLLILTDATITDLLAVRTFAEEVYAQFQLDRTRLGPVLTGAPIAVVLAVFAAYAVRRATVFLSTEVDLRRRARLLELGRARRWLSAVVGIAIGALVVLVAWSLAGRMRPFDAIPDAVCGAAPSVATTAMLAGAAAILLTAVAPGLAMVVLKGRAPGRLATLALLLLLAMPAPIVGIGMVRLLNRPGFFGALYDSPAVVVLAYVVRFLPYAVLLAIPSVMRVPTVLQEAARVDGAGWPGVMWHITLPLMRVGLAFCGMACAVLCVGEVITSYLVTPPGWETAAASAFTLLHFGIYRDLAVLGLMTAGVVLLPWVVLVALGRWWYGRR